MLPAVARAKVLMLLCSIVQPGDGSGTILLLLAPSGGCGNRSGQSRGTLVFRVIVLSAKLEFTRFTWGRRVRKFLCRSS